jgi:predicted Zn-dependent protease with MMP-like domain
MSEEIEIQILEQLEECERLLGDGNVEGALEQAETAHGMATAHCEEISPELLIDTMHNLAGVLLEADAPDQALGLYDEIARLDPEDEDLRLFRGIALLHLARFEDAQEELERYPLSLDNAAEAVWHLAVLAEFRGDDEQADSLFEEAGRLRPDAVPAPVRLGADAVQGLLDEVIEDLPDEVRAALETVVIEIDRLPDPELLHESDPPLSPFILGLHVGQSWGEKSVFEQPRDLDRILIFQRNIERIAGAPEELRRELRITLLHEIGHHLGWDEEDLARRGLD